MTSGDLAWLWGKIQPSDPKRAFSDLYIEPEERDLELQAQIASLFVYYPEGEA